MSKEVAATCYASEAFVQSIAYLAWKMIHRTREVADQILQTARAMEAGLPVMPTHGSNGFLGARRSGIVQEVVRAAPCRVLTVPVGG